MKFIVSSNTLLKKLQILGSVINTSNTIPVLDHFLFDLDGSKLKITSSDLETTMISSIEVDSSSKGSVAIPSKLLIDTLKTFPEQPLTFTMISSMVLAKAINSTIFASGNDDLRPVMSGVFFQLSSDNLTFVATDAHKLVKYKRNDLKATTLAEFIMPKKPLNILKNIIDSNQDVTIEYNNSNAKFQMDDLSVICRLIDGQYPNYEAVIPTENPNVLTIDRSLLLSSLKRVSIFSNKTTHQVRLKIAGAELNISAEDVDFSNKAEERLTCDYKGEDIEIGFNSRFLIEMTNNLNCKEVKLEMSLPNRAGILKPMDGYSDDEELIMLVMPVMLNN